MTKRSFDLIGATLLLFLSLPIMILIAAMIKIESPKKPVLFSQRRVGLHGETFLLWKFRTFKENVAVNKRQELVAKKNDPRITLVGRCIRPTHLDELPQLFNVLQGEMSLVGPRPITPEIEQDLETTHPGFMARRDILPGITGVAQIQGRGLFLEDSPQTIARLEEEYAKGRWHPAKDIVILVKTIGVILRCKGI